MKGFLQAVEPVGDGDLEGGFEFGLVQHAVGRAVSLGREFIAVAGLHVTGRDACQTMDRLGEVIPRDNALVAVVIDAGIPLVGSDDGDDGLGQVAGTGG